MNIKKLYYDINQERDTSFTHAILNAYPFAKPMDLGTHSGDILIQLADKTLLFEVKSSVNDFVGSITEGRMFKQAEGMKEITPWSFLLHPEFKYDHNNHLMGMWGTGYTAHEHWTRKHIDGAIRAIVARGVIPQSTYQGLISAIMDCVNWASDADSGSVTQEGIKLSPFDKDDQAAINLLCWFDGIGVTQAKNFLKWAKSKTPNINRYGLFTLAITPLASNDKPQGWTNHTIARNRKQLGIEEEKPKRVEYYEELDLT